MACNKYLVQKIGGRELEEDDFESLRTDGLMTIGAEDISREEEYSVHYIHGLGTCIRINRKRKTKHPIITMEIFSENGERAKKLLEDKLKVELSPYKR